MRYFLLAIFLTMQIQNVMAATNINIREDIDDHNEATKRNEDHRKIIEQMDSDMNSIIEDNAKIHKVYDEIKVILNNPDCAISKKEEEQVKIQLKKYKDLASQKETTAYNKNIGIQEGILEDLKKDIATKCQQPK